MGVKERKASFPPSRNLSLSIKTCTRVTIIDWIIRGKSTIKTHEKGKISFSSSWRHFVEKCQERERLGCCGKDFSNRSVFGTNPAAGEAQNKCGKAAELSGRLDGQK